MSDTIVGARRVQTTQASTGDLQWIAIRCISHYLIFSVQLSASEWQLLLL